MREQHPSMLMRDFLLGNLTQAEQDLLEDRLFDDPSLADLLEDAERDLFDDYARGHLTGSERLAVQNRLQGSQAQRDRLQFAFAFHKPSSARRFPVRILTIAAAVIAAALILHRPPAAPQLPHTQLVAKAPAIAAPPPVIASFLLEPGALRDAESPLLRVPPEATEVHLDLELPDGANSPLTATLATVGGSTVWQQPNLIPYTAAGARALLFRIPAAILATDNYEVRVTSPMHYYYFRVIRSK